LRVRRRVRGLGPTRRSRFHVDRSAWLASRLNENVVIDPMRPEPLFRGSAAALPQPVSEAAALDLAAESVFAELAAARERVEAKRAELARSKAELRRLKAESRALHRAGPGERGPTE